MNYLTLQKFQTKITKQTCTCWSLEFDMYNCVGYLWRDPIALQWFDKFITFERVKLLDLGSTYEKSYTFDQIVINQILKSIAKVTPLQTKGCKLWKEF